MKLAMVAPSVPATLYGSSFLDYVRRFYGSRPESAPALHERTYVLSRFENLRSRWRLSGG